MPSGIYLSTGIYYATGLNNVVAGHYIAYQMALSGAQSQCTGSYVINIGGAPYTGIFIGTQNMAYNAFYNAMASAIESSKRRFYGYTTGCC